MKVDIYLLAFIYISDDTEKVNMTATTVMMMTTLMILILQQ